MLWYRMPGMLAFKQWLNALYHNPGHMPLSCSSRFTGFMQGTLKMCIQIIPIERIGMACSLKEKTDSW